MDKESQHMPSWLQSMSSTMMLTPFLSINRIFHLALKCWNHLKAALHGFLEIITMHPNSKQPRGQCRTLHCSINIPGDFCYRWCIIHNMKALTELTWWLKFNAKVKEVLLREQRQALQGITSIFVCKTGSHSPREENFKRAI